MTRWRPAPTDFWQSPHLATLAVLDYALEVFTVVLAAQHPGALDTSRPIPPALPAPERFARKVVAASDKLHHLLVAYRAAVEPPPGPSCDDELF
jgi:hypothetical protein